MLLCFFRRSWCFILFESVLKMFLWSGAENAPLFLKMELVLEMFVCSLRWTWCWKCSFVPEDRAGVENAPLSLLMELVLKMLLSPDGAGVVWGGGIAADAHDAAQRSRHVTRGAGVEMLLSPYRWCWKCFFLPIDGAGVVWRGGVAADAHDAEQRSRHVTRGHASRVPPRPSLLRQGQR